MPRGADPAAQLALPQARALLECALRAGPVEIRAQGVSMRPVLRAGDRVRLERRPPRRGDVALVALPERLVLHRLVRRRSGRFRVRGDARLRGDGWVDAGCVLAVATARLRSGSDECGWVRLDRAAVRWRGLALAPVRCAAGALRSSLRVLLAAGPAAPVARIAGKTPDTGARQEPAPAADGSGRGRAEPDVIFPTPGRAFGRTLAEERTIR